MSRKEKEGEGIGQKKDKLSEATVHDWPAYRYENRYKDSRLRERRKANASRTVVELCYAKLAHGHLENNR